MKRSVTPLSPGLPVRATPAATPLRSSASAPAWLGPPALTDREDRAAYAALEQQLAGAFRPRDAVEWIWLRDVVELEWDIRRLRRVQTTILALTRDAAAGAILADADADADRAPPSELTPAEAAKAWEQVLADIEAECAADPPSPEITPREAVDAYLALLREPDAPPAPARDARSAAERAALATRRLADLGLDATALESAAWSG